MTLTTFVAKFKAPIIDAIPDSMYWLASWLDRKIISTKYGKKRLYVTDYGIPYIKHTHSLYIVCNDIEEDCRCTFCANAVKATPVNFDIDDLTHITSVYFVSKEYGKTSLGINHALTKG